MQHVDHEACAVLLDRQAERRRLARQHAACARQPLFGPHRPLAALEDSRWPQAVLDRGDHSRREARRPGGQELAHDEVGVPVDDDARQAVAFPVHQTVGVEMRAEKLRSDRERLVEPAAHERRVERLVVGGEHTDGDRRPRVRIAGGDEAAVGRDHAHRLSGLGAGFARRPARPGRP